jgi:hypothetical protein
MRAMTLSSTTDNDQITAAEYAWKQLYANISISRLDELKNSGDAAILGLVKNKVKIAEKQMEDQLGTGIFSNATDPKSIVGLQTNRLQLQIQLAGFLRALTAWWQAQVDSTTTTT